MNIADLQNNWAFVYVYRNAPKYEDGTVFRGEKQKLLAKFGKTAMQYRRLVDLVKESDRNDGELDLQDWRHQNVGGPSQLTPEIEAAIKAINKTNLKKILISTPRRMQYELKKVGFEIALSTVHRYSTCEW